GDRSREGRPVTGPRRRHRIQPTHVDAVLEADSDQGSIPCASILTPRKCAAFFCVQPSVPSFFLPTQSRQLAAIWGHSCRPSPDPQTLNGPGLPHGAVGKWVVVAV